jgi:hypothetical protein
MDVFFWLALAPPRTWRVSVGGWGGGWRVLRQELHTKCDDTLFFFSLAHFQQWVGSCCAPLSLAVPAYPPHHPLARLQQYRDLAAVADTP